MTELNAAWLCTHQCCMGCAEKIKNFPEVRRTRHIRLAPTLSLSGNKRRTNIGSSFMVILKMSRLCPKISKTCLTGLGMGGRWAMGNCSLWTKSGQMLDFFMSRFCPAFIKVQCDQVANVKIIKSNLWLSFVLHFLVYFGEDWGQKEDICWAMRMYVGFPEDKCWSFRTDVGQMLDKDKVMTYAGPILDKC